MIQRHEDQDDPAKHIDGFNTDAFDGSFGDRGHPMASVAKPIPTIYLADSIEVPQNRLLKAGWKKRGVEVPTPHDLKRCNEHYTSPWSSIALATFRKPPMLAPFTRLPGVP